MRLIAYGTKFYKFGIIMSNNRFWTVRILSANPKKDTAKALQRAEKDLPDLKALSVNSIKVIAI